MRGRNRPLLQTLERWCGAAGGNFDIKYKVFVEAVTYRILGSIGNYWPVPNWGKYRKYKFRAIADGSAAEIGETDR